MHGTISLTTGDADTTLLRVSEIDVGARIKRLRDIERLARDIEKTGLRTPITVAVKDGRVVLLAGARRLQAFKYLGRSEIPARLISPENAGCPSGWLGRVPIELRVEISEEAHHVPFLPSELYAAYCRLLPFAKAEAKERQRQGGRLKASAKFAEVQKGNALDLVADALNTSRGTLNKIIAVHDAADASAEFRVFAEQMDSDRKVDPAFQAFRTLERKKQLQEANKIDTSFTLLNSGIVERGDLWVLGKHRLMCGDSTDASDVSTLFAGVEPQLMVTSPPYGVRLRPEWRAKHWQRSRWPRGVPNDDNADWRKAYALFPGDVAYVWHGDKTEDIVKEGLSESGFTIRQRLDWIKGHFVIGHSDYQSQKDSCFYAVREGRDRHWQGRRNVSNVWSISDHRDGRDNWNGHGARKPVECMLCPMENNSRRGDKVYDPFVGSGTSIIAAEIIRRQCYAMEIDPDYCALAIRRWQNWTGESAVLKSTGQTFVEVSRQRRRRILLDRKNVGKDAA